jgi:molecular chaperone DnaJ
VAKHAFFERQDDNLICQIPISFAQAALGASIEVPGLNQESEVLDPSPGTQTTRSPAALHMGLRGHRKAICT